MNCSRQIINHAWQGFYNDVVANFSMWKHDVMTRGQTKAYYFEILKLQIEFNTMHSSAHTIFVPI